VTRTLAGRRLLLAVWLAAGLGAASCSSGGASTPASSPGASTPASSPGASTPASSLGTSVPATAGGASGTVWLCRPGMADNPCAYSPAATALQASGAAKPATLAGLAPTGAASSFDCFYVYPTVSEQQAANSSLTIMRPELVAAVEQASLFSQVCGVWAPMYRQATAQSIATGLRRGSRLGHFASLRERGRSPARIAVQLRIGTKVRTGLARYPEPSLE
jgi:hypothetical protein